MNRQQQQLQSRGRTRQRGNNKRRNGQAVANYVQDFPNDILSTGDIVPRSMVVKQNFTSEIMVQTAGATFKLIRFRANSLFDPDPVLGGTSYAGYTALAVLYREYRVTHLEFEWNVSNLEAFPIIVGCFFSNTDLSGVIATNQAARDALENGFSTRPRQLSAFGGMDKEMLRGKLALGKLLGNMVEYMASSGYASLNNTNPALQLFINFVLISATGANLTNGVASNITLRATSEWFNRQFNTD